MLNNLCVVPVTSQRSVDIDKRGLTVQTTVATFTIRFGICADAVNGYPDALIIDAGTVDA